MKNSGWKYFFEDGETIEDATDIKVWDWYTIHYAEDAAHKACQDDFDNRDGWERGTESEFYIIVVSPKGEQTRWKCWHEPSVEHKTQQEEKEK